MFRGSLDAVFITDTYDHSLTDPDIHRAIQESPIIHTIKTARYLSAIIGALHAEVTEEMTTNGNSISALLRGYHPNQLEEGDKLVEPVELKAGSPLLVFDQ